MNYLETIRMEDNVAQNLSYHISRMRQNSTVALPDLSLMNTRWGRVKCRIIYNSTDLLSVEFLPYKLPSIKSLRVVESDSIVYDRKFEDRSGLADLYAQREGCDDVIICRDGNVGDSYFCNLVFSRGGGLFTPDTPLLGGTKRQSLIDSGKITPCKITRDDLTCYDGVYLINAMIDLSDGIYIPTSSIALL